MIFSFERIVFEVTIRNTFGVFGGFVMEQCVFGVGGARHPLRLACFLFFVFYRTHNSMKVNELCQ